MFHFLQIKLNGIKEYKNIQNIKKKKKKKNCINTVSSLKKENNNYIKFCVNI